MSFQGLDPNRLFANLNTTGLQNRDNPLYQLLFNMIGTLLQLHQGSSSSGGGGGSSTTNNFTTIIQQILDGDGGSGGDGGDIIPGPPGVPGEDGANGMVPYFIATDETFTVPEFKQALFSMNIDNEGTLEIDGFLIEVD